MARFTFLDIRIYKEKVNFARVEYYEAAAAPVGREICNSRGWQMRI